MNLSSFYKNTSFTMGSDRYMTLLHILETYPKELYGVLTAVKQVNHFLENTNIKPYILYSDKGIWNYSLNFKKKLQDFFKNYENIVVHIHGIWKYPQYIGAKLATKYKVSFIISPHGMLEPWLMDAKKIGYIKFLKKIIYLKFVALPVFKKAKYIHAITLSEKQNLKKYFPANEIIIIPNAIDIEKVKKYVDYPNKNRLKKQILFLGRIHPIKGVDLLIRAFIKSEAHKDNWKLLIVGYKENLEYMKYLKNLSRSYEKYIKFLDPIFDERKKYELYNSSWVTVLPSHSEVIGMVNLESAACFTPTITTYKTGLLDWEEGGNILIHPNVDDLVKALKLVISWSLEERIKRGLKVHNFIKLKYSAEATRKKWIDLYSNLI